MLIFENTNSGCEPKQVSIAESKFTITEQLLVGKENFLTKRKQS